MEFYANADWAGSTTNKRSTSYCYSLLEETWLHGEAKRQMLWPKVVLKQSLKQWRVEFVKAFESKDTWRIGVSTKDAHSGLLRQ